MLEHRSHFSSGMNAAQWVPSNALSSNSAVPTELLPMGMRPAPADVVLSVAPKTYLFRVKLSEHALSRKDVFVASPPAPTHHAISAVSSVPEGLSSLGSYQSFVGTPPLVVV